MTYSTSSDISVSRLRDLRDSNSIVLSPAILEHDDSLSVFSETSFTGPKSETRTSDKVSAWLKPPEERKHNQDHRHYTKTREKTISSEPKISYRSFHTANQEAVSYTNGVDIPGPRHMVTRAQNTRGHEAPRGYSQPSASSFIQGERMITIGDDDCVRCVNVLASFLCFLPVGLIVLLLETMAYQASEKLEHERVQKLRYWADRMTVLSSVFLGVCLPIASWLLWSC